MTEPKINANLILIMQAEDFLSRLYKARFNIKEAQQKNRIWKAICGSFLQRYIGKDEAVLDIGIGHGEFINNIRCKEKYAIDLNGDSLNFLNPEVKFFRNPSNNLSFLPDNQLDVVFMSNFSEHLRSKEEVIETLLEIRRVLSPGGRLIILGPNIRYAYKEYWDFFDHHVPLSHKGVAEVLKALDFEIQQVIPKFLPFTTKSRLPKAGLLVKMYLRFPPIWKLMGKQMFILAKKARS